MKPAAALLLLALSACAGRSLEGIGAELVAADEPDRRLRLAEELVATGDHRLVPILIRALDSVLERAKPPAPDYGTTAATPETRGPELWALIVVTGQDFRRDTAAWRAWWTEHGPALSWDGAQRRFVRR